MKTLFCLCLFFCTFRVAGQTAKPPHQATVVVVQTPDSAAVALRKLATIFVAQGYTVERLDNTFFTLTLAPKLVKNIYQPMLSVKAVASAGGSSTVRVSGVWQALVLGAPLTKAASYEGSASGTNRSTFAELQQAANAYPAGVVSYSKQ